MSATKKPLKFDMDASPPVPAEPANPKPVTPKAEKQASGTDDRKQVGARINGAKYRALKARAAIRGATTGDLVELAITEWLDRNPE